MNSRIEAKAWRTMTANEPPRVEWQQLPSGYTGDYQGHRIYIGEERGKWLWEIEKLDTQPVSDAHDEADSLDAAQRAAIAAVDAKFVPPRVPCPACDGEGVTLQYGDEDMCHVCRGRGTVSKVLHDAWLADGERESGEG